jgi:hypothetical protein
MRRRSIRPCLETERQSIHERVATESLRFLCRRFDQWPQSVRGDSERAAGEAVDVGGVHSDDFCIGVEHRAAAAAVGRGRVVDQLVAYYVAKMAARG